MDKIDLEILSCLKENARMKSSDISKKINLSLSAVIERIKKMEQSGIIGSYTIALDQKRLGNDLSVLIEVTLEHPRYFDTFTEMAEKNPNIQSCFYLTGEYDFMLRIFTDSTEGLERIHKQIKSMPGVQNTKTHFVLKTLKDEVSIIPEEV